MSIFSRMLNLFKPEPSRENKWVCMLDQVISNQPGACPKCGRQLVPRVEIDITFTDEEKRAIHIERESWNSATAGEVTLEPGQRLFVHPKMANAIDAFGLIAYVQKQVSAASNLPEVKKRMALRE